MTTDIDGTTRIYAVIGDPIEQVRTPALINPVFAESGTGIVAVPLRIRAGIFDAAWDVFASIPNLAGLGVTVPHKVAAARRCDRLTPAATAVGAVNCVRREADGSLYGALFDGIGFVRGLGEHRDALRNATVMLVGAGGAGRAIAHALAGEGIAKMHVVDRDRNAVGFVVDMVNRIGMRQLADAQAPDVSTCDVLINATPVGLTAGVGFPVPPENLQCGTLVADIASLSRETELLALARERGCRRSDGVAMLQSQIDVIAGFVAGRPEGTPIGDT